MTLGGREPMECSCCLRQIFQIYWQMEHCLRKKTRHSVPCANHTYLVEQRDFTIQFSTKNRLHQFSSKALQGVVTGYALNAGSGGTGDLLIADAEELRKNAASEVYVLKIQRKRSRNSNVDGPPVCARARDSRKIGRDYPSRHKSKPSRSYSIVVADISGCLPGEKR